MRPLYEAWAVRDIDVELARSTAEVFLPSHPPQARTLLAYLAWREGRYNQAAELALASLNELRQDPPSMWLGHTLNILGCLASDLSRLDEAMELFTQQLEIARALQDPSLEAIAIHDMGMCQVSINPESARFHLQQALAYFIESDDYFGIMLAHLNLGILDQREQLWAAAKSHFELSLEQIKHFHNPSIEAAVRGFYLDVLTQLGALRGVQEQIAELRRLLQENPQNFSLQIEAAFPIARHSKHDPESVIGLLLPIVTTLKDVGLHRFVGELRLCLSAAYEALGNYREAYAHTQEALTFERQLFAKEQQLQLRTLDVLHRTASFEKMAREERRRSEQLQAQVQELQRLNVRIQQLGRTDSLTGLANRYYLFEAGEDLAERATEDAPLAVALIDIDRFKQINDTYGHLVGDQVLANVASQIRQAAHENDLIARYGGEEFVILRPSATQAELAQTCFELQNRVSHYAWEKIMPGLSVSLSIGVAQTVDDLESALHTADQRMYMIKGRGGKGVQSGGS